MLTSKDREQLHTIASAMGVKAATRMRKADLIDAILAAAPRARQAGAPSNGDTGAQAPAPSRGADRRGHRSSSRTRSPRSPTKGGARASTESRRTRSRLRRCRRAATVPRRPALPRRSRDHHPTPANREHRSRRRTESNGSGASDASADSGAGERATDSAPTTPRRLPGLRGTAVASIPTTTASRWRRQSPRAASASRPRRPGTARATRRRTAPGRVPGRPDRRDRPARPARRGLRLPPRRRLPPRAEGRLRVGVAGATVRAAQGRLRARRVAPAGEQREVPGAPPRRRHQRPDARRRAQPAAVRRPHAAVPRLEAAARAAPTTRTR